MCACAEGKTITAVVCTFTALGVALMGATLACRLGMAVTKGTCHIGRGTCSLGAGAVRGTAGKLRRKECPPPPPEPKWQLPKWQLPQLRLPW